jgi:hypothetical protein
MGDNSNGAGGREGHRPSGTGCLKGLFSLLLVAFVVGFLVIFFGLGTDRGKKTVRDWLEKQFAMELSLESAKLGGAFELIVENIVSKDTDEYGEPVFKVKELKVGLKMDGTFRISAHRAVLMLMPGKKGGWVPSVFGKLGDIPRQHMGDLSKLTGSFRKRISVSLADSSISWIGREGVSSMSVSGLSFEMRPLYLPERDVYFYRLEAYNVLGSDNINIHNIKREWLASDAADYVAVDKLSPQAIVPANGFWEIR